MKIGIIVHSQTGNTYSVGERLKDKLLSLRHIVSLEKMIPVNDDLPDIKKITFRSAPGVEGFDAIIFGAPVRGMALSPAMSAFLSQMQPLEGKRVMCYVTEQFPYPWMGGNRAIKQMKGILESKGAAVLETAVINWSNKKRNDMIETMAANMAQLI